MRNLNHRLSQRTSIQTLVILGIGLITLALWMLPALAGSGSASDFAICGVWAIVLICLLMLNYRRALRAETQARTIYVDRDRRMFYHEKVGMMPYRSGCQLTAQAASCFANTAAASFPKTPDPDEFQLSAIIRTTAFDHQMNVPDPDFSFENMTVREWSGVIEVVEAERTFVFNSLSELEDLLCSSIQADAISMVGQCPAANANACLRNERIIRSSHES